MSTVLLMSPASTATRGDPGASRRGNGLIGGAGPGGSACPPRSRVQAIACGLVVTSSGCGAASFVTASPAVAARGKSACLDGVAQLVADHQAGRFTKWLQQTCGLSQGAVLRLLDVN